METIRPRIHWIIMFIGAAAVGISVGFENWAAAAIFAICTIGAFIFNVGAFIAETIHWYSTSVQVLLKDQEYERLKREMGKELEEKK